MTTAARIAHLCRYRKQFTDPIDTAMHDSAAKNWRDYFIYGLVGSGLMAGAIALIGVENKKLYALAPVAGALVGGAVSKRDDQHRRVPSELATSPRRFAADVTIALDNSLAHLQAVERVAGAMAQSADQFSLTLQQATSSKLPQTFLGKGFE